MNAEDFATAIGRAIGARLEIVSSSRWSSITFAGLRMRLQSEDDLPADIEAIEPKVPGYLVADMQKTEPRVIEVLLVENGPSCAEVEARMAKVAA